MNDSAGVLQNGNRKLLGFCAMLTLGLNTPTFFVLNEHWNQITALEEQLREGTKDRYYRSDHVDYDRLIDQRFENVKFRFERNEEHIKQCLDFIRGHHLLDEKYRSG